MANVIAQGVMILDTASATPVTKNQYLVTGFRYVSASAAAGDECKVQDNGATPRTWFDSFATGADWEDAQTINTGGIPMNGVILATLTSGICYIYFK